MKNGAVVLGVFMLVGIVIGAFVISFYGQEQLQENDLNPVNHRIDGLAHRMDSFESKISELDGKLEDYLASLDMNNRNIRELKEQLAAAGREADTSASNTGNETPSINSSQEIIENLKEEVKKEIKEETKIAQGLEKAQGLKKWADSQTQGLQKRMDGKFPFLAKKINLDRNQEIAVKNITEELIKQVSAIWSNWEQRLSEGMTDGDWGELKGELGGVYDNAEQQLQEHVSEEQARAIMGFIRGGGK